MTIPYPTTRSPACFLPLAYDRIPTRVLRRKTEWFGFVPFWGESAGPFHLAFSSYRKDRVLIDPKILFQQILGFQPSGVVLLHNHPSENLIASAKDQELTSVFEIVARLIELEFHGHLVVTPRGYLEVRSWNAVTALERAS